MQIMDTPSISVVFFFLNDPAPTEIYTLSTRRSSDLVLLVGAQEVDVFHADEADFLSDGGVDPFQRRRGLLDRKSTRLNSSHRCISYAVFCLKKKTSTL